VIGAIAGSVGFTLDVVSELAPTRCLSGFIFGMLIFRSKGTLLTLPTYVAPWRRRHCRGRQTI